MKPLHHLTVALATWATCVLCPGAAPAWAADATAEAPAPVVDALQSALTLPGARVDVVSWKIPGNGPCNLASASLDRPVAGSGRYALRLEGAGCGAWGWATVRVFAPGYVTTRPVRAGEPLEDAVKAVDQEIRGGRSPVMVTASSKASRAINIGQLVEAAHVEVTGPSVGSPIKVLVRTGSLVIEQTGRAVSCGRGRVCAILPSGKHVEGTLEGDVLVLEVH